MPKSTGKYEIIIIERFDPIYETYLPPDDLCLSLLELFARADRGDFSDDDPSIANTKQCFLPTSAVEGGGGGPPFPFLRSRFLLAIILLAISVVDFYEK